MDKYHDKIYDLNIDISKEIKQIYKDKYNFNNSLENIHLLLENDIISQKDRDYYKKMPIFGKNDRQSFLVKDFYEYYDSNDMIRNNYLKFINDTIKPLLNTDKIVYQTTPNIRFHLPNCTNIGKRDTDPNDEIIGLHSDSEFNHPESELNVILPITEMYDTNTIYYNNIDNSLDNFNNLKLNENQYFTGYFNKVLHHNKINLTNKTRISFDFRVIPFELYNESEKASATSLNKYKIGEYYSII
jgi:hypothetical protein